jgi:general secretion pathway protein D
VLPIIEGSGGTAAVLDPGSFSAVIRAVENVTDGRTMTMPRMLVNNNETATLGSVLESPYTSTNASNTVATTSFGGSSQAGTQISIKPQVAAGDSLVLDYDISISGFVGEQADPNLPPPRQDTNLKSVVTVPDGFTVIVGGLEQESETSAEARIPWLGEIPLVGRLFSSTSESTSKSRFFVFMRCTVMRSTSFEELKYLSRGAAEELGVDDGWPKLEPRVIR